MSFSFDDHLINCRESGWKTINIFQDNEIHVFCEGYKKFLDESKTEREVINNLKIMAEEYGFKNIEEYGTLTVNDKIYYISKEKSILLAIIGQDDINKGINLIVSHADSPRLDLKPNPLYQEEGFAYLKTHYYGGIKKYQWATIPLALHGIVVKTSGEKVELIIGENKEDPIFTITDLLPHLASEQMEKKLKDGISGEDLNILIGNIPANNDEIDSVKLNVLRILNEIYNFKEIDFISSEIEFVPAFKSQDVGLDRSMIAGYGQDNRASVYSSFQALLSLDNIKRTAICFVADKEEVGNLGNTSVSGRIFDLFIKEINNKLKITNKIMLDNIYYNSHALCADVDAGLDPIYDKVYDKNNTSFLSKGLSINKYSGSEGKIGCSDANAEYVSFIRRILEDNNVLYQIGEVGKVDAGGGGTTSYIFANKGMEVIDCGIAILSMHSPYEVISKYDLYTSYKAYKGFFESV